MKNNRWGKISSTEPVSRLRKVPIVECGEPLINFLDLCSKLVWDKPRWRYKRERLLRNTVAKKLCKASEALPKGYKLAIVEGWRPIHIQKRMHLTALKRWREAHPDWSNAAIKRQANRFTAPLDPKVPPPHTTGGALDIVLADGKGRAVDHNSPYKTRESLAYPFNAGKLTEEARKHRMILKEALESAGITNYPSEFWHYSYGDQGWAYRGGHAEAIYGQCEPPGYEPPPEDANDKPLEWVG